MTSSLRLCALLITAGLSATTSASVLPLFATGEAYASQSGEFLYLEMHFCREDGLLCEVQYRDGEGGVLATKFLDYQRSAVAPQVVLQVERLQEKRELLPPPDAEHVVDAGFDNYVRSQWDALLAGQRVTFRFQPMGFDRPFAMRAEVRNEDCDALHLCLQVRVDSWLLGLVAKPLQLVYSRDSRRLLQYSGVSNLRNAEGETPEVDIRYRYPTTAAETP
ncbi:MAG: hypothetical protein Hals2KO_37470 [Halioglobus sp.]